MDWVTTFLTAPAIMATVNLLKKYGLPSDWAPLVSLVIGALFGALVWFLMGMGPVAVLTQFIVAGLAAGLTASGFYDAAVTVGATVNVPQATEVAVENVDIEPDEPMGARYLVD